MKIPDTHKLTDEQQKELDQCVKRMRELNCIVIAYSPEDIWNMATRFGDYPWDESIDVSELAADCHEDDLIWDQLMECVQSNYDNALEVNRV